MPVSGRFIREELSGMKTDKSTGLDDVSARFLKDGADFLVEPVKHIINMSILTEIVPDGFKNARVKPLFKKGSRLDPGNYRPVSILPVLSKVLEKAVNGQFRDFLETNKVLFEFQSGFRSGYSTDTCLISITDHIRSETSKGNVTGMVLIDLQKAFDTCDHSILLRKLLGMGVTSVDWFRSYLSGRQQCVQVGDTCSSFLDVTCGVPQGSILGPTLFLCYINDMSMVLKCKLALYADDSALIASGSSPGVVARFLGEQLTLCRSWLVDNRLSLHMGKTESILFGTSRKVKGAVFEVVCGDTIVKRVTSVRYLGVILDQCLNFREHATEILKKANGKMRFLYRCASSLRGRYRRLLCSALVGPSVEYCCSAWYPSLLEEFKRALGVLQRKMVRFVGEMGPREHVEDGDIWALGWMPFHKRVEFVGAMHVFKIKKSLAPSYISSHFRLVSSVHSYGLRQCNMNYSLSGCPFPPKSFTRSAILFWNSLPSELKSSESLRIFRKGLISYLKQD